MPRALPEKLLDRLDEAKRRFDLQQSRVAIERILARLSRQSFKDAESLSRYHEILLFLRAYPQSTSICKLAEAELAMFASRIDKLPETDTSTLEQPEISGIAGTSVTDTFTYNIVRWLVRRHPTQVSLNWEWFEDENPLAQTWPGLMPLLEEDAAVEANVPYRDWLRAAKGRERELHWLIKRFEALPISAKEQGKLYDSLKLYVQWRFSFRASRTGMRLPVRRVFYHRQPLIARRDVSLERELMAPHVPVKKLSHSQGERILDLARETSTVRYRELYGFTHGDSARVLKASIGRGVELFFIGVPPEKRLPIRAYHAAVILKNGVPVGYFEGLSLCERMESGFNLYYTFREGETAWIYAKTLAIFHQLLGITAFSIDPYQIGYENDEGIASGAFWFYRKLGFRPTAPALLKLTLTEEQKLAARSSYRTPTRILRRLAEGRMIFELAGRRAGDWDRFEVRKLGLAVQRRMASDFSGHTERIRHASVSQVMRALNLNLRDWKDSEQAALDDLALLLALIPDLSRWSESDKGNTIRIIRAKAGVDEAQYLQRLQRHSHLRAEIIRLGS